MICHTLLRLTTCLNWTIRTVDFISEVNQEPLKSCLLEPSWTPSPVPTFLAGEALSGIWGLLVSAQKVPRSAWSCPWLTMGLMKFCTHQTLTADRYKYVLQVCDTLSLYKVGPP